MTYVKRDIERTFEFKVVIGLPWHGNGKFIKNNEKQR